MIQQHTQTIQAQHNALTQSLALIQSEHEDLATRLVSNPSDIDLLESVEQVIGKMETTKRRIALFEAAASVKNANDSAASRLSVAVASRDEAVDLSARRITVAKDLDKTMATFGELMDEYAALNDHIASVSIKVLKHAQDKPQIDSIQRLSAAARSNLNDPLVSALHRASINRLAPGSVNLVGRAGPESFKDVATTASARLAGLLDSALQGGA